MSRIRQQRIRSRCDVLNDLTPLKKTQRQRTAVLFYNPYIQDYSSCCDLLGLWQWIYCCEFLFCTYLGFHWSSRCVTREWVVCLDLRDPVGDRMEKGTNICWVPTLCHVLHMYFIILTPFYKWPTWDLERLKTFIWLQKSNQQQNWVLIPDLSIQLSKQPGLTSQHDFYCWERSLNSESEALSASFTSVTNNLEQGI